MKFFGKRTCISVQTLVTTSARNFIYIGGDYNGDSKNEPPIVRYIGNFNWGPVYPTMSFLL